MNQFDIVTGEKVQILCDLYFGYPQDFHNPFIRNDISKHFNLYDLVESIDNPKYIFCYAHRIKELSSKIHLFSNQFVLVTGNSDENITNCREVHNILSCPCLIRWFAQNVGILHEKLKLVPIGFANSMWKHGDISLFKDASFLLLLQDNPKTKRIYFQFNINTNVTKRKILYEQLTPMLDWLEYIVPIENVKRLREYQFCICPEGNGYDTHRLWEALYLKVVPIVIKSPFTTVLQSYDLPMVVLEKWDDLDETVLDYNNYSFDNMNYLNTTMFDRLKRQIYNSSDT